jgi:hypothetical protein
MIDSWLVPICGKQAETNVIECSKCLNWLHYKCEKMTVSTYRTHAISNDLEYNCKSCKIGDSQDIMSYCSCIYICCGWLFLGWKCAVARVRSRFYIWSIEKMTVSTYRTHAISNDLEYNCKSCKCMKEMNELTELYQRGDEVEESSIDTTCC